MKRAGRRILSVLLAGAFLASQGHALQVGNRQVSRQLSSRVTKAAAIRAQSPERLASASRARWGNSQELMKKAWARTRSVGATSAHVINGNLIQASVIMIAVAAAELTRSRLERDRLLDGQTLPSYEEVQTAATAATQDLLCAQGGSTSVMKEIGCSGEIWVGAAGGIVAESALVALRAAVPVFDKSVVGLLTKLVVGLVSSYLLLAGMQMSGFLWTEAVNALDDPEAQAQAHGLFGRLLQEWVSGRWETYKLTEDGRLAEKVLNNMYAILVLDDDMRAAWMDNTWRFGIARGEFIVTLTALMTAMTAGTAAGGALATAVGATAGWQVALISGAVATAFGAGIAYGMVFFPDAEIGSRLTGLIQDVRLHLAGWSHEGVRASLRDHAEESFTLSPPSLEGMGFNELVVAHVKAERPRFVAERTRAFTNALGNLPKARTDWVKVAIEKYQELRQKEEESRQLVTVATEVIRNSEFRKYLQLSDGGRLLTYDEAKGKFCREQARCNLPMSYQLESIARAERIIAESARVRDQLANRIVDTYGGDFKLLGDLMNDVNLQYPEEQALRLVDEYDRTGVMLGTLLWYFASYHDSVVQKWASWDVSFSSEDERNFVRAAAGSFLDRAYVMGLNEQRLFESVTSP